MKFELLVSKTRLRVYRGQDTNRSGEGGRKAYLLVVAHPDLSCNYGRRERKKKDANIINGERKKN